MNLEKNHIPDKVETIHLIAACGTAMGALACILKDKGYRVTGSDQNVYPPMSTFLAEKGISLGDGFDPANLDYRPDLVVVGNTVSRDNSEVEKMVALGLAFCSMPQALNRFLVGGGKSLLVTGTHGKTTTSSLMAWVLHTAGLDPAFMIGGILKNFSSNYRIGRGDYVVIEGDEYDTAYFDKGPKFLHYRPAAAVLTSVEFDHADIFRDLRHVKDTFQKFSTGLEKESLLVAYDADENVSAVLNGTGCRVHRYGEQDDATWQLEDVAVQPPLTRFAVRYKNRLFGRFKTRLPGKHNLLNALSVIAVAHHIGVSAEDIARALDTFRGIKRRQEIRGAVNGVTVMDDFAHHPTAVRETLKAVKPFYPDGRLIAVFEPRTSSSMRAVFQDVYPTVFDAADLVCIREPSLLHKIPENERFSASQLVADICKRGVAARYFEDTDKILEFVTAEAVAGDVVLIMSNGGFDNIHQRLLENLEKKADFFEMGSKPFERSG
ncbi:MAG: UDP-N-acetylmuramate:L-alanyl-gamma-D-glutamyl-meso-diaminopimelate ligase [Desulfobacterales bacterium]|nr:UDP-N-acetylmuramate:L-alanyl-gamma-D-glutamyl-meso-diaminopimelate ligase [Desulfobacterales bacterium]